MGLTYICAELHCKDVCMEYLHILCPVILTLLPLSSRLHLFLDCEHPGQGPAIPSIAKGHAHWRHYNMHTKKKASCKHLWAIPSIGAILCHAGVRNINAVFFSVCQVLSSVKNSAREKFQAAWVPHRDGTSMSAFHLRACCQLELTSHFFFPSSSPTLKRTAASPCHASTDIWPSFLFV